MHINFILSLGGSTLNISPEKSPDLLQRPKFTKLRSPERSPILTRRSRSHERSPERARHLRQLKHRSLEIPSVLSRSPDISKRRSHYHEGSSESDDRLLDQASTPIPIPSKLPASHSPSSSETTPEKSSPQGDETIIEGHVKTESEDSMGGGSEAVTPKLEEPPADIGRPDRSASVTGEIEQLPPLPEETLLSPDVISPSLKVASADKQKGMTVGGSETSKPVDNEQLLFDMLDDKEGSTEVAHGVSNEPQSQDDPSIGDTVKHDKNAMIQDDEMERAEKSEGAEEILAELDELDVILDAEEEEEEEEEEQKENTGAEKDNAEEVKKELDGAKLDRTDTVDGGEMEEHREIDKPLGKELDVPPDSVIPNEVESENKPPVEVEDSPPGIEPRSDLKSRLPETTIEVTEDGKQGPSTGVESEITSQIQVELVKSLPEGECKPPEVESAEPPVMDDIKTAAPLPPSVELELQIEPGAEPIPIVVDSEQPDVGYEPQESIAKPETSEAECKPPQVQPGQSEVVDESQNIEPEAVGTAHKSSLVEPHEDKLDPRESQLEPQDDKPEPAEVAAKEEPSELPQEAMDANAEPTHSSQGLEVTVFHKEPPETSSKSEASNQASVHESSGEVEQPIASLTEEQGGNDERTIKDSSAKSERGSHQSPTKCEGESDQSPAKSEGESDQSLTKSEGENEQIATENEKGKSEQSLKKEDSLQESDER